MSTCSPKLEVINEEFIYLKEKKIESFITVFIVYNICRHPKLGGPVESVESAHHPVAGPELPDVTSPAGFPRRSCGAPALQQDDLQQHRYRHGTEPVPAEDTKAQYQEQYRFADGRGIYNVLYVVLRNTGAVALNKHSSRHNIADGLCSQDEQDYGAVANAPGHAVLHPA